MGGGVLPVAFYKGKLYFLFSREYINSKDDGGLWSDFGGSKDNDETYFQTALREGYEESDKIIGSKENIKNLMKNSLQEITINGYRTYIVLIRYDKELPKNDDGDESVKPMRVDARRKQFKEKLRKLGYSKKG